MQRALELGASREKFWQEHDGKTARASIARLLRIKPWSAAPEVVESHSVVQREGYHIEKFVLTRNSEMPIPALLFVPEADDGSPKSGSDTTQISSTVIYVNGRGKGADAGKEGPIEKLVRSGKFVLAIDVRGYGETFDRGEQYANIHADFRTAMLALHIGRPLLGQRVGDIIAAIDYLQTRNDIHSESLHLVGIGQAGPVALHAAVVDERINHITLRDSITSWVDDVVGKPLVPHPLGNIVPGALQMYDLSDLVVLLGNKLTSQ